MKLENSHVVLTGATGGIGRALAAELAARGAVLTLVGRDPARLHLLDEELTGNHHIVVADLSVKEDRLRVIDELDRIGEPVDLLINNAGVAELALYDFQCEEQIERMINVNLLAPMLLTKAVLSRLRCSDAQILNIGSTFGSIAYPGFAAYSASKFGLRGFSEALTRELADRRVLVQYAAPRATRTPLNSPLVNKLNSRLGNRTDEPDRVAEELCAFIESGKKSLYIGWPEKLFVRVNAICGAVVDRAIRSQLHLVKQTLKEQLS